MRIYISGKVSGDKDYLLKFRQAENYLAKLGFAVVNPAKIMSRFPIDTPYAEYIDMSIKLLDKCDGIYMLSDWEDSYGARIEYLYASATNKNIIFQNGGSK